MHLLVQLGLLLCCSAEALPERYGFISVSSMGQPLYEPEVRDRDEWLAAVSRYGLVWISGSCCSALRAIGTMISREGLITQ